MELATLNCENVPSLYTEKFDFLTVVKYTLPNVYFGCLIGVEVSRHTNA